MAFAVRSGRGLADNTPEVMLSPVLDTAVPSGLDPSTNQTLRTPGFPYIVPV
jgi:hypothetical protein